MELSRDQIERSDFSSARRGYEPAEVDAHLREIASAVEQLADERSSSPEGGVSVSSVATERVRVILDAAEASAAEIRSEAEVRARELEERAEARLRDAEAQAVALGGEHAERIERRVEELTRRANALDAEFDTLLDRMRSASQTVVDGLRTEVEALRTETAEVTLGGDRSEAAAAPAEEIAGLRSDRDRELSEAEGTAGDAAPPADTERARAGDRRPDEDDDPTAEPAADQSVTGRGKGRSRRRSEGTSGTRARGAASGRGAGTGGHASSSGRARSGARSGASEAQEAETGRGSTAPDTEGARLIALNMALSGSPREETADYLRDTFGLEDNALLDDVYRRVQAS